MPILQVCCCCCGCCCMQAVHDSRMAVRHSSSLSRSFLLLFSPLVSPSLCLLLSPSPLLLCSVVDPATHALCSGSHARIKNPCALTHSLTQAHAGIRSWTRDARQLTCSRRERGGEGIEGSRGEGMVRRRRGRSREQRLTKEQMQMLIVCIKGYQRT